MRRVRYNVAATLDGYIAGPNGEYDWIPEDATVDFASIFARVDTVLLGRRSYEVARTVPEVPWSAGTRVYVFSQTLRPEEHPGVTIVRDDAAGVVASLRAESGDGDIWLFGGGVLFGDLLAAGSESTIEKRIRSFADAGTTDISFRVVPIGENRDELIASSKRTREYLASLTSSR